MWITHVPQAECDHIELCCVFFLKQTIGLFTLCENKAAAAFLNSPKMFKFSFLDHKSFNWSNCNLQPMASHLVQQRSKSLSRQPVCVLLSPVSIGWKLPIRQTWEPKKHFGWKSAISKALYLQTVRFSLSLLKNGEKIIFFFVVVVMCGDDDLIDQWVI